ncbi:MAG: hypothetical protein ABSD78_18350 [Acidimicrobiales bacterium]
MTDCVFCRIIAGDAPASVAFEDDETIAIMDLRQDWRQSSWDRLTESAD